MGAFHAYDIRGIYNTDFNKDDVYKMGFFLPQLLKTNKIIVGRDDRTSSPEIFEYLTKGITDAGADVYDIGLATTPLVYFSTVKYNFSASVQITASHNPREYNGLKVSRQNALPVGFDTGLGELQKKIQTETPAPVASKGKIVELDARKDYIEFLKKYKGDYSNLKIGVDISNGMAALFARNLLGDAPLYINEEMDGTFPNHEANPLIPKNVEQLQKLVRENKCDVGAIFDGDADRVMFVDENGTFISPDLMIAALGHYFLEDGSHPHAKVLQDIRTSKAVGEYLAQFGAEMHTWRVGRAFAAPKLREIDGLYGGELAGHYYFKDFSYSDSGMLACLLILQVIAKMHSRGISLSQLIAKIAVYKNSGEINFKIENKQAAMDAVRQYFTSVEKSTKEMDFDGYRVEFPDWWFNIRPSNTEPYLRFIAEAKTNAMLAEKVAKTKEILQKFM